MDPSRTKPAECSVCSDTCERNLSTFCGDPVDIVSYVEKQHKPFMTVYPTAEYLADEEQCAKAKDDCNAMFVTECANSYQVLGDRYQAGPVSGMGHYKNVAFLLQGGDAQDLREAPCRSVRQQYFALVPTMVKSFEEQAFRGLYQ